ncbi:MAG: preprotein translocase subunit YajC [Flavobacteriaceae bacterium]|jgi:preprotein translocase subunit YajC|nr:preprotein translocase subunit YajC [Flavobacteriaceae bacterium]
MEGLQQFLPIILMFVVIYFLMIRPQQKKMKQEKEYEANIKVGDRIVTKSGIHGRINELNETTVVIETMAGKLLIERSAISMEMTQKLNEKK